MNTIIQKLLQLMHLLDKFKKSKAYITLISVLIVSAAGSVIAISVVLLGNAFAQSSLAIVQSNQAKGLANACAEYSLERIVTSNFTGMGSLNEGEGSCSYDVTSQGGESRTITTTGAVDGRTRKIRIVVSDIIPEVIISSWQEVSD